MRHIRYNFIDRTERMSSRTCAAVCKVIVYRISTKRSNEIHIGTNDCYRLMSARLLGYFLRRLYRAE